MTYSWSTKPSGGTFSAKNGNSIKWSPLKTSTAPYVQMNVTAKDTRGGTGKCPAIDIKLVPPYSFKVHVYTNNLPPDPTGLTCSGNPHTTTPYHGTALYKANIDVGYYEGNSIKYFVQDAKTDSKGIYSVSGVSQKISKLVVCASYSSSDCSKYKIFCPEETIPGCVEITPDLTKLIPSGTEPTLAYFVDVQLEETAKSYPWVSAVNGDVYAQSFGSSLPACKTSTMKMGKTGFLNYLINSTPAGPIRGYGFSEGDISDDGKVSVYGGFSKFWGPNYSYLQRYVDGFNAPLTSIPFSSYTDFSTNLKLGVVYSISAADFNSNILSKNPALYKLSPTGSSAGAVVIYVSGDPSSDKLSFKNPLKMSTNLTTVYTGSESLLIVTNVPVEITPSLTLGYLYTALHVSSRPNIEASIISSQGITVKNEGTGETNTYSVYLQGPIASLTSLNFENDLGLLRNSTAPPQAVRSYPYQLYWLTKMERDHLSQKSYTGLGIYDVQWEYQN